MPARPAPLKKSLLPAWFFPGVRRRIAGWPFFLRWPLVMLGWGTLLGLVGLLVPRPGDRLSGVLQDGEIIGAIGAGLLALVAIERGDLRPQERIALPLAADEPRPRPPGARR